MGVGCFVNAMRFVLNNILTWVFFFFKQVFWSIYSSFLSALCPIFMHGRTMLGIRTCRNVFQMSSSCAERFQSYMGKNDRNWTDSECSIWNELNGKSVSMRVIVAASHLDVVKTLQLVFIPGRRVPIQCQIGFRPDIDEISVLDVGTKNGWSRQ